MRYIGNKENIIDKIYNILKSNNVTGKKFFDFFSGTTNVARFYKDLGYTVVWVFDVEEQYQNDQIENYEDNKWRLSYECT